MGSFHQLIVGVRNVPDGYFKPPVEGLVDSVCLEFVFEESSSLQV